MTVRTFDYTGQMPRELARSEAIIDKHPDRSTPLRSIAQALSRRGVAAAKCELVNAALVAMVDLLFEVDDDGATPNVDPDGRILPPAPWGRNGGRLWGLRATEQRTLNVIMRQRNDTHSEPLFVYDTEARHWLLGRAYKGKRAAHAYLRTCPITMAEWRAAWQVTRSTWASKHLGED